MSAKQVRQAHDMVKRSRAVQRGSDGMLEKAGDDASKLQGMIDLDFNYKTHDAGGTGTGPNSLIGQLMASGPYSRSEEKGGSPSNYSTS